jgi:diamine N-acetyltransferase
MDHKPPTINIRGDKIALGPLEVCHAEVLSRWHNDYAVMRNWAFLPGPRTVDGIRRWFEPGNTFADPQHVVFGMYESTTWELVGFTGLYQVEHIDRVAEFFVMIGDEHHRGKGYGTETARLVLDHAFLAMGLSNVFLRVFEYNLAGIRAYEKAGFRLVGVRRKSKFMGGKMWDMILMDAVAEDFESPVLGGVLIADRPQ